MIGKPINWKAITTFNKSKNTRDLIKKLRSTKGLSYKQIAIILGISKSAVWNKAQKLVEEGKLKTFELTRTKKEGKSGK